jgi:hypothetical protein
VAIARKYAKKLATRLREKAKDSKPAVIARTTNNIQRRKSKYLQGDQIQPEMESPGLDMKITKEGSNIVMEPVPRMTKAEQESKGEEKIDFTGSFNASRLDNMTPSDLPKTDQIMSEDH